MDDIQDIRYIAVKSDTKDWFKNAKEYKEFLTDSKLDDDDIDIPYEDVGICYVTTALNGIISMTRGYYAVDADLCIYSENTEQISLIEGPYCISVVADDIIAVADESLEWVFI